MSFGKGLPAPAPRPLRRADSPRTNVDLTAEEGSSPLDDREAYIEFLELHLASHRRAVQRMNTERLWFIASLRLLRKKLDEVIDALDGKAA